jgi:hydroxypyruvate isomerase
MPKFSANLSFLYQEFAFSDRFAAAARDGFKAVEYMSPYDMPKEAVAALLAQNGLAQALFNLPAGDWANGERGIACHPNRVSEFRNGVELAADYAQALGCGQVNCLAGIMPEGISNAQAWETFIGNLAYAANHLSRKNIRLLIEPINHFDIPGFLINTTSDGMNAIETSGSDNLFLQYDIYHMQRMEGTLAATLERLMPRIAHIQIADNPGRHEPGTGEINYPYLLRLIDELGYKGWIGCEYTPLSGTSEGLGWMRRL